MRKIIFEGIVEFFVFWSSSLKKHTKIHTGETELICWEGGESFICAGDLDKHNVTHTGEKKYVCGQCKKSFFTV